MLFGIFFSSLGLSAAPKSTLTWVDITAETTPRNVNVMDEVTSNITGKLVTPLGDRRLWWIVPTNLNSDQLDTIVTLASDFNRQDTSWFNAAISYNASSATVVCHLARQWELFVDCLRQITISELQTPNITNAMTRFGSESRITRDSWPEWDGVDYAILIGQFQRSDNFLDTSYSQKIRTCWDADSPDLEKPTLCSVMFTAEFPRTAVLGLCPRGFECDHNTMADVFGIKGIVSDLDSLRSAIYFAPTTTKNFVAAQSTSGWITQFPPNCWLTEAPGEVHCAVTDTEFRIVIKARARTTNYGIWSNTDSVVPISWRFWQGDYPHCPALRPSWRILSRIFITGTLRQIYVLPVSVTDSLPQNQLIPAVCTNWITVAP